MLEISTEELDDAAAHCGIVWTYLQDKYGVESLEWEILATVWRRFIEPLIMEPEGEE